MARRGRVVCKRQSKRGARCRRNSDDSESDDGDEEYIVGDEEDSECSDEFLDPECSDNASDGEEEEQELFVDDEDDDFSLSHSRRTRKKKADAGDDEELELSSMAKRKTSSGTRKRRKLTSSDEDEDFDPDEVDFDQEDVGSIQRNLNKNKKKNSSRCRGQPPKNKKTGKANVSRRKKKVKKAVAVKKSMISGRRKSDDDFIVDGDDDDDDDFVVKDRVGLDRVRKNGRKRGRNFGRKRSKDDSDEDFDFIVDSSEEELEEKKGEKKISNNNKARNNKKRKRSTVEDSESEFDSFVSDEDFRELDVVPRRKVQKRTRTTRKKKGLTAHSDSSDFDYEISESELKDLQIGFISNPEPLKLLQLSKRPVPGLKIEVNGKEKDREDAGKQVCGICLSEEQKATIQGVLDCCTHYYCFQCIVEWSKVESRCPVCKRRFTSISKSGRSDQGFGLRRQVIKVPKCDQVYQPSEEEMRGYIDPYENVVCIVCQQGGEDSLMLLCDICDSSAHTYCVGLGREVPEGNWYCEACRLADYASPHSLFLDSVSEQGVRSGDLFSAGTETEDLTFNLHSSTISPQPVLLSGAAGQHLPHGIDLNAPPRDCFEEDLISPSQASGTGASTLSGRRAIHQRIRFILSSNVNRMRELFSTSTTQHDDTQNDVRLSVIETETEPAPPNNASRNMSSILNSPSAGHSRFRLSSCMHRDDKNFRHVDGAKKYVQSRVKDHLKKLSKDIRLDHSAFKDIARRSTHTVLAACGIEHRKEKVIGPIQCPSTCTHGLGDRPVCLAMGCCISCLDSLVESVLLRAINTSS